MKNLFLVTLAAVSLLSLSQNTSAMGREGGGDIQYPYFPDKPFSYNCTATLTQDGYPKCDQLHMDQCYQVYSQQTFEFDSNQGRYLEAKLLPNKWRHFKKDNQLDAIAENLNATPPYPLDKHFAIMSFNIKGSTVTVSLRSNVVTKNSGAAGFATADFSSSEIESRVISNDNVDLTISCQRTE